MGKNVYHIQHIKSNVVDNGKPKLPNSSVLVEGEIAVNYADGYETLSIKTSSGNIATFSSDTVREKEQETISAALNYLNDNKLDVSTYNEDVSKQGETIHYLTGMTGTSGGTNLAASWSGSSSEITELYTGLCVRFIIPIAGHASGDTLSINGGEKHTVFYNASTKLTTHYGVGTVLNLTYDADTVGTYYSGSSTQASVQGVWRANAEYYSDKNTDVYGYYIGNNVNPIYKTDAAAYRYMLLLQKDETTLTPVNTKSNTTAGTKTLTTSEFDPFGTILYKSTTGTVSANASFTSGTTWTQYPLNLAYSFNTTNTLVALKSVYIVAVPQSNGKAKLHSSPITQTLPTTDDGLIYIYLGQAYSTTNVFMPNNHPVYQFKNGELRKYVGSFGTMAYENISSYSSATEIEEALSGKTDISTFNAYSAATDASIEDLSGQSETISAALNVLNDSKLDASAFTDYSASTDASITDLSGQSETISAALNVLNESKLDASAFTGFSAATDTSIEDLSGQSETISFALNVLNDSKLDASAYTDYGTTIQTISGDVIDLNEEFKGLGRESLKENLVNGTNTLTQEMLSSADTIYSIAYDYVCNSNITVPANCVLEFNGGSISGGNITLQGTYLNGDVKFDSTVISGSCANDVLTPQMFGAIPSLEENENNKTQHTLAFQNLVRVIENQNTISKTIYISAGHYAINEKLSFKYINKLYGEGESTVLDFYDGLGGLYIGRYSSENQYNRCTILNNVTITEDVPNQQTYIIVNDVTNIDIDDWLIITDSADYSFCGDRASYRTSELVQVRDIDSVNNIIYFKTSLYGKYFVSYTEDNEHTLSNIPNYRTIISKFEPLSYDVSNIKIISHTSNSNNRTYYTFHVCGFINSNFNNINIYNYGNDVAANITIGSNFVVENCIIKSYTEYQTDAYGLSLSHVQNFKIFNSTFNGKSHALSHGGSNSVFGINNRNFIIEQIYIDKHQEERKIDIDVHANAEYYLYKNIICPHALCDTGGYNVTIENCILYDISTGFHQAGLTIRGCELMNCSQNHLLSAVYPEEGHPEANPLVDYSKYSFIFESNKFHKSFMFDLQNEPYYFRNMIFRNNICEGSIGLVDGCMYNVFIENNISSKGGIQSRLSSEMTEINNNIVSDGWINVNAKTDTKGTINNNIIKNSYPQDIYDPAHTDYLLVLTKFTGFVINNNISCLNDNQQIFIIYNNCDIQFNNNYFQRGTGYYDGPIGDALNSNITFNSNVHNSLRSQPIYNDGTANIKCDKEYYNIPNYNRNTVLSSVGEPVYIKNTNKLGYVSSAPYGNLVLTLTTPSSDSGQPKEAIAENTLTKNKVYHVRMRVNDLNEIYFSKTINHNSEDLYRVWYENNGTTGIIEAPDPTEYPYIYVKSYNYEVWFRFYENRALSEYDGAMMGVNRKGSTSNRPIGQNIYEGFKYFDTDLNKYIYAKNIDINFNTTWVESDGAIAGTKRIGTTAERPTGSSIYVGFRYFDTTLGKELYASEISGDVVTWTEMETSKVDMEEYEADSMATSIALNDLYNKIEDLNKQSQTISAALNYLNNKIGDIEPLLQQI